MHCRPSFQLGVLLPNPIRDQRVISPHPLIIRDRIPVLCGVVIAVCFGTDWTGDVENGRDRGCEDEAFEGRILLGGLEDGERPGDCGFDYCF